MRIAGSLPLLPHRFMVSGETLNNFATSRTVRRSGRLSKETSVLFLDEAILVVEYFFMFSI